jgi:predicted Zn-dependent protease
VEAQLGVAQAQIAEGSFSDAVQQLEPLSRSQPGNATVFELLAQAYAGVGRKAEAEQAASKAKLLAKNKKP